MASSNNQKGYKYLGILLVVVLLLGLLYKLLLWLAILH